MNSILVATIILISASIFTVVWSLDSLTHKKILKIDITDRELQTHRNILVASLLMEISLVLIYWDKYIALPFFITFLLIRLVHEFIDELKFHVERCTPYENYLHLIMWSTVYIKTFLLFTWGFFYDYNGIELLPLGFYIWAGLLLFVMGFVSLVEWQRKI